MEKLNLCTKNISGVYIITNLVNGKRYIGSTNDLYERCYSHIYHLNEQTHSNKHLQNAWNKYGADKFVIGVLEYVEEEKRLEREAYYIKIINPEYNIAQVLNTDASYSEERKQKISESVTKSWKEGKLKERRESAQCWINPCYIYDITDWSCCKECNSFKEACSFIGINDFEVRNDTIGIRLFKERYVVYLDKIEDTLEIKNRICKDILYYNSMNTSIKKYLIAEDTNGNLYYYRKLPHLINQFGSSKSTLTRYLKTATKNNPYIIPKNNVKVYYSNEFIKHQAV